MNQGTLGRYTILHQIGSGGMGDVFAATDPELQRSVAIKVLRPELSARPELVRRFEREARALAALEHPNVVSVHSVEAVDGVRFLTMELVEGESLADRITRRRPPLRELIDLGIQLADAVAAAHDRGITHRDLKPGNVMISNDGRVKVLDFGLAKKVVEDSGDSGTTDNRLTSEGAVLGTVSYMSPEQAEGRPVDHRSDIFSLGVILYEMATGALPFQGDSRLGILAAIINDTPLPVIQRNPRLPRHLDRIVQLTLEKDREHRLQSAKDLRNELEQLLREITTSHVPETPIGRARRRPRAYPLITAALVGVAVGVSATIWLTPDGGSVIEIGRITRVTGGPELETHPAVSPSGEFVVYTAGQRGSTRLYSRSVAGGKQVPLADELDGDKTSPAFLPDGRVAFGCQGRCWVVQPLGGGLRPLDGVAPQYGMCFSPDRDHAAYATAEGLVSCRLSEGEQVLVAAVKEVSAPSWSPDGTRIAFVGGNPEYSFNRTQIGNIGGSEIWIVPAGGGEPVLAVEGNLNASPVWRGSDRLLFVSDRGGTRDVYSIEVGRDCRPLTPPRRLTTGLDVHTFSLSGDGTRMAFTEFRSSANIWSLPIPADGTPVSTREAEPITHGHQSIEGLSVSTDGKLLLFDSNIAGNQDVYRLELASGALRQLTEHPREDFMARYSPDGDAIVFYSFRDGTRDLYVMAADGSNIRQITSGPAQDRYPYWSPDGNRIAFYSDRSGQQEIWVTERDAATDEWGPSVRWTSGGGQYGRWSRNGRTLLYSNASQLWIVTEAGGEPHPLLSRSLARPDWPFPNWSVDGKVVYYKTIGADDRAGIWSVPASGGEPTLLVDFDRPSMRNEFDCDRERFYFTITEQEGDIFTMDLR